MKTGNGLVAYAKEHIGTPYFYGAKMKILTEAYMQNMHDLYPSTVTKLYMALARAKGLVGRVCVDCSGLIGAYREKQIGSSQLYSTAKARLNINDYQKFANGVVLWRKGHVGVFFSVDGNHYVIEAKGINYGTVLSNFRAKDWTCGLTFADMLYEYGETAEHTAKEPNPYVEPNRTLKKGDKGEMVKWVQWELCEAGYKADLMKAGGIDGDFGKATEKAVKAFQKSCKIGVDGIVGNITRAYLKGER